RDTALSADAFNEALRQISAKRLLVILDCCHAAGIASAKGEIVEPRRPKGVIPTSDPKGLIDALSQGVGRVVFTSCRGKQSSWVRDDKTLSIYTHHLIEALQGVASQSGATEVTVFDLANHLGKAVPESAATMGHEQNPRFEMADTERFAIALLQGGKGLPKGGWDEVKDQMPITGQVQIQNIKVEASGDRAVAAQNAQGATINTGDNNIMQNVTQQGKYSVSIGNAQNMNIGDRYNTNQDDEE
ncbi:MAG: caspase family protein, partial [Cyanobacteria bacterium P01_D01_bin.56]